MVCSSHLGRRLKFTFLILAVCNGAYDFYHTDRTCQKEKLFLARMTSHCRESSLQQALHKVFFSNGGNIGPSVLQLWKFQVPFVDQGDHLLVGS